MTASRLTLRYEYGGVEAGYPCMNEELNGNNFDAVPYNKYLLDWRCPESRGSALYSSFGPWWTPIF